MEGSAVFARARCANLKVGATTRFKTAFFANAPIVFSIYLTVLSSTHPEIRVTCLFSSTHWEHFFCPFVFNNYWEDSSFLTSFLFLPLYFQ